MPEQARGQGKEAGPAADVCALAATPYEMLTSRPPFRAVTPLETRVQVPFAGSLAEGRVGKTAP